MKLGILALLGCGLLCAQDVKLRGGNVLSSETYSFRHYLLENKLDVFAIPELYKKFGIKGISYNEMFFKGRDDAYLDRLKAATDQAGRVIVALQADGDLALPDEAKRKQAIEHYKESLHMTHRLGAPVMRINAGTPGRGEGDEVGIERLVVALKELLPVARQLKIRIAIENHGGVSAKADNLLKIIQATDPKWVGVQLDFGNFRPEIRYDEIQKVAAHAFGTHVKVMQLDDRGEVSEYDLPKVFKILKAQHYKGPLSIEFSGKIDAMDGVPKARDLILKYW